MKQILKFIKKEPVLIVAIVLAIITCFFVPPDQEYINYFDYGTLICLFCMLLVVAALKSTHIFEFFSKKLIGMFRTRRGVIFALVFGTFFFDMIVANDMSLITFLPLTYLVLHSTNNDKYLAITFVLQTIAANMGGMITPYGNPQNLYLTSFLLGFSGISVIFQILSAQSYLKPSFYTVLAARFLHGVASFLLSVLAFSIFKPDITTLQGGIKAVQYPLSTTFTIIICAILFLVCLNPNNRNFARRTKNVKINL